MSSTSLIAAAVKRDGERFGVVALAAARFALDPHIGQKVHFDPPLAVPFARLASSAGHIEAEAPGRVAAELGFGKLGEERADSARTAPVYVAGFDVGELPERLLIDADDFVDMLQAANLVVRARDQRRPMQLARDRRIQHVFNQRTLAAAARPGDGRQRAERNLGIDVPAGCCGERR